MHSIACATSTKLEKVVSNTKGFVNTHIRVNVIDHLFYMQLEHHITNMQCLPLLMSNTHIVIYYATRLG